MSKSTKLRIIAGILLWVLAAWIIALVALLNGFLLVAFLWGTGNHILWGQVLKFSVVWLVGAVALLVCGWKLSQ